MKSLEETLLYRNPLVVKKFMFFYALDEAECDSIFVEMLKWLWVSAKIQGDRNNTSIVSPVPPKLYVQAGIVILDEMWHFFILHTRDYCDFCKNFLGLYLHHSPSYSGFAPPTKEQSSAQLEYLYENLGESTMRTWYVDYASKYSIFNIESFRKPFKILM